MTELKSVLYRQERDEHVATEIANAPAGDCLHVAQWGGLVAGSASESLGGRFVDGVYYGTGLKDIPEPGQVAVRIAPDQLHNTPPRELSTGN